MRTTEVVRTEKRKPRLSSHKSNQKRKRFSILIVGICIFAKLKIRMRKKGIIIPKKRNNLTSDY